jgi:small subunit ribosomal protein S17
MAADERDETTENAPAEETAAEEPRAEETAAEEAPATETPAEEAPAEAAEEAPAEEAPAEAAAGEPAAADAEPEERLTPKQRRRRERARHSGEARPPRSADQRSEERARERATKAEARRRGRARARARRGEPGAPTPPRDRQAGSRKVRRGVVVSAKPHKTITVRIEIARRHSVYEKVVRRTSTVHAHDEREEAQEGDVVRVVETRPRSKTKRWRLVEVLERKR